MLPADAWKPGIAQDGGIEEDKHVAEITRLMSRAVELAGRAALDRPAGEAVPPPDAQPHRLREAGPGGGTRSSARTSRTAGSAASRAATTRSTSTWSTGSTPSWKPAASAPPRPWVCERCRRSRAGQLRLGHRREHRRRPGGLDPPARLATTTRTCGTPTPIRCATGSGTSPPAWPVTPASASSRSALTGPGRRPSSPAGSGCGALPAPG